MIFSVFLLFKWKKKSNITMDLYNIYMFIAETFQKLLSDKGSVNRLD